MSSVIAGIFFSLVPALMFGAITAMAHPVIGLIVGVSVFGFGLDCCFRGSDRENYRA